MECGIENLEMYKHDFFLALNILRSAMGLVSLLVTCYVGTQRGPALKNCIN